MRRRAVDAKGILLAVIIIAIAGCGQAEWSYLDEAGREWPKIDSVATKHGEVAILTSADHEERCAVKLAVNAIAEVATAHPEHNLTRHDPKYFFVHSKSEALPTMCLASGKCVDQWENIPSWLGVNYPADGYYYYRGGQFELIFIKRYPKSYWLDFSSFLEVVIHEEMHGLGSGYAHGPLMDKMVGIIHERAVSDLPNDPECRDIRLYWWQ